jgi:hypothetical protein
MSLHDHPKEHSPQILSDLEAAYVDVWNLLPYARMSRNEEATREVEIALRRSLAGLASEGVTNPKDLRRRAFEAMVFSVW